MLPTAHLTVPAVSHAHTIKMDYLHVVLTVFIVINNYAIIVQIIGI